ncbi:L-arabinitol 4-dehydrogenase [Colletotrichum shisoi]|uniref:L-arabinitol 4-dehydrogenase n=1 Tax=Colletotrichum shisoi TaxID=2078593 RepID=A0A5Q4BJK4_9PEZI|nr:L-arabinitol 4-dehydrogenase [Colletotrichum shisoi]
MVAVTVAPEAPVNGVAVTELKQRSAQVAAAAAAAAAAADQETLDAPLPNPSLVVTADHQLKAEEAPVLAPKRGEALVHVKATGVCGSDIHFWKTGRIGSLVFEGDCIIGHEAAGVVIRCGEGVKKLKPGDRVAVEPGVPCGECFLCADGRYNLCEDVQFAGVYPYHGTIQRYKCHPAKWLHKYRDTWPAGIACLSSGILDLKSLISHTFPLERAVDALTLASDYRNGSIKVQIVDETDSPLF